jgi:hypothetical protein
MARLCRGGYAHARAHAHTSEKLLVAYAGSELREQYLHSVRRRPSPRARSSIASAWARSWSGSPGRGYATDGVVATQMMRSYALDAAQALAAPGAGAEPIDLRTLVPLDGEIGESVGRTHHVVVAEEASPVGGWSAQLIATIAQERFESLDAPPRLVSGDPSLIPFAAALESAWPPGAPRVADAVLSTLGERLA